MRTAKAALIKINALFEASDKAVYWHSDLIELFEQHKKDWALPASVTTTKFVDLLLEKTKLKAAVLRCNPYPPVTRYAWNGIFPPLQLALSIKRNAFLSHGSALWVHGLAPRPSEIYVNQEQSPKALSDGDLTQDSIDRAFKSTQRVSKLIYQFDGAVIRVLAGKNTGRTEVAQYTTPDGETVAASSPERSLIESVVRPAYAGGIQTVMRAFQLGRNQISIDKLQKVLVKFEYVYPYHQALGFYLQRAGYPQEELEAIRGLRSRFRFYLSHGLKDPAFDDHWQVFYPPLD